MRKFEDRHTKTKIDSNTAAIEQCKVMCSGCRTIWNTTLSTDYFYCLNCKNKIEPRKHVIVKSENEIN